MCADVSLAKITKRNKLKPDRSLLSVILSKMNLFAPIETTRMAGDLR